MSDYIDSDVLLAIHYPMFKLMDIFREKKNCKVILMVRLYVCCSFFSL